MILDLIAKTFGYGGYPEEKVMTEASEVTSCVETSVQLSIESQETTAYRTRTDKGNLSHVLSLEELASKKPKLVSRVKSPASVFETLLSRSTSLTSLKSRASIPSLSDVDNGELLYKTIVAVLLKKVRENDRNPVVARSVSCFHGYYPPSISLQEYFKRITKYAFASPTVFVVAVDYLFRLAEISPMYCINSYNVHRLLITCVMLAVKYMEDTYYDNAHFAKVGGLSVQEINKLELEVLSLLKFKMYVSEETFTNLQIGLVLCTLAIDYKYEDEESENLRASLMEAGFYP